MTSRIDTAGINENFPKPRAVNDTQGFRDNFGAIKTSLDTAGVELSRLQAKYLDVTGDVGGFSGSLANTEHPVVPLRLTLADTGVAAGSYRNPVVSVDAKGRVVAIADGSGDFLSLDGGTLRGGLTLGGNLDLPAGGRVQGRRPDLDGAVIDRLQAGVGLVMTTPQGIRHRGVTAGDGVTVADDGSDLRFGIVPFRLSFEGDVTGRLDLAGLTDAAVRLEVSPEALMRCSNPKLGGPLDMQGHPIRNPGVPRSGDEIGDRNYNDGRYLQAADAAGIVVGRGRGVASLSREIVGENGLRVRNGDGITGNPVVAARDFTLQLIGDVSGSAVVRALGDTQIRVRLLNTWTKAEIQNNFLSQRGGTLAGDLAITGGLTVDGRIQGRDLAADGRVIDALAGGAGLMVQKTDGRFGRCVLTGEDGQIRIVNGDGGLGHPVIGLVPDPRLPGTGGVTLPGGTTAQRPQTPLPGSLRYSSTSGRIEAFQQDQWSPLATLGDLPAYAQVSAAEIHWDLKRTQVLDLRLDRDAQVSGVANAEPGRVYRMLVRQGGTAAHTVSFGPAFRFSGAREVSPRPGTTDIIEFLSDGEALYGHVRPGYV